MKLALIVTGLLAAIAIVAPSLVILGLFFIVPGLVLLIAPTAFVYLAATALIRSVLPLPAGASSTGIAFGISILIGWAVMQPFRAQALAEYNAALQPSIEPAENLRLNGCVRLERNHRFKPRETEPECDYVCAALLDNPRVQRVSITQGDKAVSFALVPAHEHPAPGIYPTDPGRITRLSTQRMSLAERQTATKAVEARWALRLASDERLIATQEPDPNSAREANWLLRQTAQRADGKPHVHRVEIIDADGETRFRSSYVRHLVPARFFHFGFDASLGGGSIGGSRFHIAKQKVQQGDIRLQSDLNPELLAAIDRPSPTFGEELIADLRTEVEQVVGNPNASLAQLELPRLWLSLFNYDVEPDDMKLVKRIVADERITEIVEPLKNAFRSNEPPVEMRIAFARRILMRDSTEKERRWLAQQLAKMPEATFAKPDDSHVSIWNDREIRCHAAPFIERLADLDADAATPALLDLLEESLEIEHWHERRPLMHGICAGFTRLGPDGASAIPRIRELFLRRPSPIMNNSTEAFKWRLALLRMGVAIDDLPFFPTESEKSIASSKERLKKAEGRTLDAGSL